MKHYNFTVVVEKDEDGNFLAICPALQGCYTEGDTKEQALELIEDAIKLHIEDRIARGENLNEEVYSAQLRIAI